MKRIDFGRSPDGARIELFELVSPRGVTARITNYGGIITHLFVPDRAGNIADVVLGFDSIEPYFDRHPYFGAIVGRLVGRMAGGNFAIDGISYSLPLNQDGHHFHGGATGFDRRIWTPEVTTARGVEALTLRYRSPEGEEGYPGNVDVAVTYSLTDDAALHIDYEATTDRATPLNLTNHSYFNLRGESAGDIRSHELQIFADEYTPVNPDFSHTGRREPLKGGPNDFRQPAAIRSRLDGLFGRHGDHYILHRERTGPEPAARIRDPDSGRTLEVATTEPCLQFYTGVNLDGSSIGKSHRPYGQFAGFCLECQGYPGALEYRSFPSILLRPGEIYRQHTVYRFST